MKSLSELFKKIKISHTAPKHESAREYVNPARDWMIGLVSAVLLLCVGVGIIAFDFYTQFGATRAVQDNVQKSISPYPTADVRRLTEEFAEREVVFMKLRDHGVPDPVVEEQVATVTTTPQSEGVFQEIEVPSVETEEAPPVTFE